MFSILGIDNLHLMIKANVVDHKTNVHSGTVIGFNYTVALIRYTANEVVWVSKLKQYF